MSAALVKEIFSLSVPFSEEDLKNAYKREAKKAHPDVGGTKEAFQKLQDAYTVCSKMISTHVGDQATTETGELLSELGKGLGNFKNGVTCVGCNGKGYQMNRRWSLSARDREYASVCYSCKGTGETEIFNPVIPKGLLMSIKIK